MPTKRCKTLFRKWVQFRVGTIPCLTLKKNIKLLHELLKKVEKITNGLDETELRAFFLPPLLSLPLFFSPSKKKRHKI